MNRTVKWLTVGISVSVALNLLMIGFIAHAALTFRHGPRPHFSIEAMAEQLSPEARDALKGALVARRDDLRAGFRAMIQARRDVRAALTAEQLDHAKLEAAFAEVRAGQDKMQTTMQQIFSDAASRMPYEDRVKLANAGERILRDIIGGGRRHRPPGPGPDGPRGRFGPPPAGPEDSAPPPGP